MFDSEQIDPLLMIPWHECDILVLKWLRRRRRQSMVTNAGQLCVHELTRLDVHVERCTRLRIEKCWLLLMLLMLMHLMQRFWIINVIAKVVRIAQVDSFSSLNDVLVLERRFSGSQQWRVRHASSLVARLIEIDASVVAATLRRNIQIVWIGQLVWVGAINVDDWRTIGVDCFGRRLICRIWHIRR